MGVSVLLQSLASSASFAARPFVTVFLVALLARFSPEWFAQQAAEQRATLSLFGLNTLLNLTAPAWLVHDYTLIGLGLLAVIEFLAHHNEDAQAMLDRINGLVKPASATILTFGLLDAESATIARQLAAWLPVDALTPVARVAALTTDAGPGLPVAPQVIAPSWLGVGLAAVWAVAVGGITWFLTWLRHRLLGWLTEADEDDSLGLRRPLN